jgi:hypothetical protein
MDIATQLNRGLSKRNILFEGALPFAMLIFTAFLKMQQNGEIFQSLFFHENDDGSAVRIFSRNRLGYFSGIQL